MLCNTLYLPTIWLVSIPVRIHRPSRSSARQSTTTFTGFRCLAENASVAKCRQFGVLWLVHMTFAGCPTVACRVPYHSRVPHLCAFHRWVEVPSGMPILSPAAGVPSARSVMGWAGCPTVACLSEVEWVLFTGGK